MAEEKKKNSAEVFDIFIADQIYPEAEKIFTARLKPLNEVKDDCFIILDTNSLLVPYNTGKESIEQIKQTYRSLVMKKRLVIPGQVAREFAKNRANKIMELFQQLNRKANTPKLQRGKYPLLESLEAYQKALRLEGEMDETLGKYRKAIEEVLDHIKQWTWNDPVSLMYGEFFDNSVVFDPPIAKETIQAELTRRQIHGIPPGYKDASKEDGGVGDFLIWPTILEIGKVHKKSAIFVSGEEKADWRYKSEGQTLYPRFELADEYRRYSGGESFHILQFSSFLNLYGASEEVVEEVRQEELQVARFEESPLRITNIPRRDPYGDYRAQEAMYRWLLNKYPSEKIVKEPDLALPYRPDFAVIGANSEIKAVDVFFSPESGRSFSPLLRRVSEKAMAGYYGIREGKLREFTLAIIGENPVNMLEMSDRVKNSKMRVFGVSYFFFYLRPDGDLEELGEI